MSDHLIIFLRFYYLDNNQYFIDNKLPSNASVDDTMNKVIALVFETDSGNSVSCHRLASGIRVNLNKIRSQECRRYIVALTAVASLCKSTCEVSPRSPHSRVVTLALK